MAVSATPPLNVQSSPYAAFVRDALASGGGQDRANQARAQAEAQGRQQAETRSRAAPPAGQGSKLDITA